MMMTYTGVCKYCHDEFSHQHGGTPMKVAPEFCNKAHRKAYLTETAEGLARSKGQVTDSYLQEKEERIQHASNTRTLNRPEKTNRKPVRVKDFRCPRPLKQDFRSLEQAEDFIKHNHPDDDSIRPYRCRCSSIHIGHPSGFSRPEKTMDDNVFTGPRSWCAHPKKTAFRTVSDAHDWAGKRYLSEHYEVFSCTCNYQHLRVTPAGKQYRDERIRLSKLQS